MGRMAENGQIASIDPMNRAIAVSLNQGLLKIIPIFHASCDANQWIPYSSTSSKTFKRPRTPTVGDIGIPFNIK